MSLFSRKSLHLKFVHGKFAQRTKTRNSSFSSVSKIHSLNEKNKENEKHRYLKKPFVSFRQTVGDLEKMRKNLELRGLSKFQDLDYIIQLYEKVENHKDLSASVRKERNFVTKSIGKLKCSEEGEYEKIEGFIHKAAELKEMINKLDMERNDLEDRLNEKLALLPNAIHPDVQESGNVCIKILGEKRNFDFSPKNHIELGKILNLFEFKQAARVSGPSFYYLKNGAALMEIALIQYAMSFAVSRGFTPVISPDIIREEFAGACGFQPKDESTQTYSFGGKHEGLCLSGTAEIPMASFFEGKELKRVNFPEKYVAFGRAFRAEAGSSGVETSGLYRVHQFSKVELFCVTGEDSSDDLLIELREMQEEFCNSLGIHAQVLDMAADDLGAPAYRKFDIEAWMPGRNEFGEISSASNCRDYQSRRLNIKYRDSNGKSQFAHTLNGTACAIPRVMIAILENYQRKDGNVDIPEALRCYMGGMEHISI